MFASEAVPEKYFDDFITMDEMNSLSIEMKSNLTSSNRSTPVDKFNLSTGTVSSSIAEFEGVTGTDSTLKERGTWRITDKIFNSNGQLTSTNTMDMYILEVS